jgi:carbonic anhydrase
MSCLAVIQYAVTVLKVNHIILCGHYECGGVKAALDAKPLGLIDSWLRNIQDVYRIHKDELDALNYEPRVRRLIELNVMEQALNLYKNMFVQQTQKERRGFPKIHGLVFDLKEGRLKRLDLNIKQYLKKYGSIYTYNPDENAEDRPH